MKEKEITKGTKVGTKEKEIRVTFIASEALHEKIKLISYWDRITIKEVLSAALNDAVSKYEKANGPLKPIPKK